MLTADPDLEIGTNAPTGRYGKSNQLANPVPIEHLERIVWKYTTIYVIREKATGVVPAQAKRRLR